MIIIYIIYNINSFESDSTMCCPRVFQNQAKRFFFLLRGYLNLPYCAADKIYYSACPSPIDTL